MTQSWPAWIAASLLVLVHVGASGIPSLDVVPRSRWLSAAGGISVGYAFVHLLPELAEYQKVLQEAPSAVVRYLDHHAYLIALAGLVTFYGLERAAKQSRRQQESGKGVRSASKGVFWLSIGAFSLYNAVIGYLLMQRANGALKDLSIFTAAMALHFVVNDYGLHRHHQENYKRVGRWILSAAIFAGAVANAVTKLPPSWLAVLVAFLAGGIILNVLKEELPEERESRFGPFLIGVVASAALLLAL